MRILSYFAPLLFLAACASPDVSSFKQSTLALTTGLKDNQAALVEEASLVAEKRGKPPQLVQNINTIKQHEAEINESTAALAGYASAVASLAGSGEDGADAAQTMLNNVASAVGAVSGKTPKLPSILDPLTSALGKIIQQNQNKRLHEIMLEAKPHLNAFADQLTAAQKGEQNIVTAMALFWSNGRQDLTRYHKAYEDLQARIQVIQRRASRTLVQGVNACPNNGPCDYAAISQSHTAALQAANSEIADLQGLLAELQPYEDNYQAFKKEIDEWQKLALARISSIPDLARAWKNDHETIITYLAACTDLSGVFNSKCGAFSSGNLELFGALLGKAAFPF